jgi:hypothetical protein
MFTKFISSVGSRVDNHSYYKMIQIPGSDIYIHGATDLILIHDCRFQGFPKGQAAGKKTAGSFMKPHISLSSF